MAINDPRYGERRGAWTPKNGKADVQAVQAGDAPNVNTMATVMPKRGSNVQLGGAPVQANRQAQPDGTASTANSQGNVQITSEIPAQYKASSYADLIPEMQKYIDNYRPLTKEQLEKLRRRQKAEGVVAGVSDAARSIANLMAAVNYAPNMYDPTTSMSQRTKERWEKEKAEREANAEKYINYQMMLAKMRGEDKDRALNIHMQEQQLARQDQQRREDVDYRNKQAETQQQQWQQQFTREGQWHADSLEQWQKQFDEGVRQFNVSSANEAKKLAMEGQRLARSMQEGQVTFSLGDNNGNVTITNDKLNLANISRVFNTLPAEVRNAVKGEPIYKPHLKTNKATGQLTDEIEYDRKTGKPLMDFTGRYAPPDEKAMLIAIGANVGSSPDTQRALRQLAASTATASSAQTMYGVGGTSGQEADSNTAPWAQ